VSISFKQGDHESPALFSHWGGMSFVDEAKQYLHELKAELKLKGGGEQMPIDRLEPGTVMVDFIRHITEDTDRVESSLYLGQTKDDGDNSDNGHYVIDLGKKVDVFKPLKKEKP